MELVVTIAPFANKKNSMKTMLDASGDLALWYTGEEIVVFDFGSNTEIWRETVKCKKSKDPNFAYYCFGMLSPRQSKAAYRVTEGEYVPVSYTHLMRYIDSFDVLEEPKAEPSMLMSQLPDALKERGLELSTDPEALSLIHI